MFTSQHVIPKLSNTDPAFRIVLFILGMQRSLFRQLVKSVGHEGWDRGVCCGLREDEVADIEDGEEEGGYSSNLEAMSCQSESEGSSDGTGEGEAGEGGAGEELVGSEGMRNLVSGELCQIVYN
jgi:hypothetical protein